MKSKQIDYPIRIAQIMGKMVGGGVEATMMNYYRNINRDVIQFDFICDEDSTYIPYKEIEELGGRVILIPPYQKILKYHNSLKNVLKEGKYQIVHSHINTLSVFSLWAAKSAGVPIRIAHSHSTTNKKEWTKNIIKLLLRPLNKIFSNYYMACSEVAGRWMFGDVNYEKGKVFVLNNAIDIEKFSYNARDRKKVRRELNINNNSIVIGHVGRFTFSKNQEFIIKIFKKIHEYNENSKLLLIGDGSLKESLEKSTIELNLKSDVIFLGQRDDIFRYYNAMDVFLLPSLYEGLGMVAIEAQVNKLPCLVSENVPKATKISNGIKYIGLDKNDDYWSKEIIEILKMKREITHNKKINCYDIKKEASKLEKQYLKMGEDI